MKPAVTSLTLVTFATRNMFILCTSLFMHTSHTHGGGAAIANAVARVFSEFGFKNSFFRVLGTFNPNSWVECVREWFRHKFIVPGRSINRGCKKFRPFLCFGVEEDNNNKASSTADAEMSKKKISFLRVFSLLGCF